MNQYHLPLPGIVRIKSAPPSGDSNTTEKVVGSLVGLALGSALTIEEDSVYLRLNSWTGATAMAVWHALSLIEQERFDIKDREYRYVLSDQQFQQPIDRNMNSCSALMRLASVSCFFHRTSSTAVELCGESARVTHNDRVAVDACRYYGALIVAALRHELKDEILSNDFYKYHRDWFGRKHLHRDISRIADELTNISGEDRMFESDMTNIANVLKAALYAFRRTESFADGISFIVQKSSGQHNGYNTIAAIYGQLAGAYYRLDQIPEHWTKQLYAGEEIIRVAKWIDHLGQKNSAKQKNGFSRLFGCTRRQS